MKPTLFTLFFLFYAAIAFSQIKGYTEYDDEIWLYDDGTWEYAAEVPIDLEPVSMMTPPFKGMFSSKTPVKQPKITQLSAKENQITDDEDWFERNELTMDRYQVPNSFMAEKGNVPQGTPTSYKGEKLVNAMYDEDYNYFVYGVDFSEGRYLLITDKSMESVLYAFDFDSYRLSPEFVAEDKDYISQRLNWAKIEDGTLYVSHGHSTYAYSSKGMNAYLTAINLEDNSVIWRTQPLVSNAQNFIIHNDNIVCGYGFTNEKDYLYTIDKNTGKVNGKILLKSGPSYIVLKNTIFYVRTYNMDYTFKIE